MKPIERLFGILLLLTLPGVVQAQFTYVTNNGTITITGYSGPGGDVIIPDMTNGLPVTSIGDGAFIQKPSLTSVTIPNSVTNIGTQAFINCYNLTRVTMGNGLISIGSLAFKQCRSLTNVIMPTVTSIRSSAFQSCNGLTNVIFGGSLTTIEDQAFNSCLGLTSITIPQSVTSIGSRAFSACQALTTITVNAGNSFYSSVDGVLFDIGQTTLIQCPGGKPGSYTIPNSVTDIQDSSFENCTSLTDVTIGNNVTNIGNATFVFCTSLTSVTIGTSVTAIGTYTFGYCLNLANITIPNGLTNIADYAFTDCRSLASITLPPSVTTLGGYVFYDCYNLTSITIPDSVTSIGDYEFAKCYNLTSFTIGPRITNIGLGAFAKCTGLTSVTIPDNVTNIDPQAFVACTNLTAITVNASNSAYSSLDGVLFDKNQTTLIEFPGGKAGSYTIPNGATSIGAMAFEQCNNLSSVIIPNSVTNIGQYAFYWCFSLTEAFFLGDAPRVDPTVFSGDTTAIYYLPGTKGWGSTFGGLPTAQWFIPNPLILNNTPSFGVQTNGFAFIISWATNVPVVVEACTNLANPVWSPLQTNALTSGSSYFTDPEWTNYSSRFYRIRSP